MADPIQIDRGRKALSEVGERLDLTARLFLMAGNETRLRILFLLNLENELCVCDLSDMLEMKIPAVSQHLRKLKDAGMVDRRREAQTIYYFLQPAARNLLKGLVEFVEQQNASSYV